jgi:hypothetical protein
MDDMPVRKKVEDRTARAEFRRRAVVTILVIILL